VTHKHTPEITAEEREKLFDAARELAAEFDRLGASVDAETRFPMETVPLYKASGLPGMAVPRRWGGLGADIGTVAQVGRLLARGDAAIALSYNMHQSMVGIFRNTRAMDDAMKERLLGAVARDSVLMCGPFSEARAGLTGLADTVAVPQPGGGWKISGKKNWATLIEGCDVITTNATVTDADGKLPDDFREHAARETTFVFPKDLPGVSIDRTWDTLGMRATGSHTLVLDEVFVGPEADGGNFRKGLIGEAEWAALCFGGVYLGLADRAYAETCAAVKKKHTGATLSGNDSAAKSVGYVQYVLGRMRYELDLAERTLEATAAMALDGRFQDWPEVSRKPRWDVAKVATTEAAISLTDQGLRLVGGAAFRRGHVLERLFRDARAGINHSFGTDQLFDFYGRYELGLVG
jgi:alkylation response protein AidB-like acyl-CoA dehydrogenase